MEQEKQNNSQPIKNSPQQTTQSAGPSLDNNLAPPINEQDKIQITGKKDPKISKKTMAIVGSILVCVLLVCIIGIIMATSTSPANDNQVSDNSQAKQDESLKERQPTKKAEKPATTADGLPDCSQIQDQAEIDVCTTIASVAEYLADRYYSTDGQIVLDYNYRENEGSIYKPEHLIMATASIPGHHAYEIKSKYASANEYLLDNGFTEVSRTISGGMWDIPTYINYENGVVCEGETIFLCSNIEWYPSEGSDDAELLNSLAEAAMDAGWDSDKYAINATTDDIVNSEFSPYQTINVGGTNAIVSFYRVEPTSGWQIGYTAQAVMLCSSFDNIDKQKAYASVTCQVDEAGGLTTVKEYYSL